MTIVTISDEKASHRCRRMLDKLADITPRNQIETPLTIPLLEGGVVIVDIYNRQIKARLPDKDVERADTLACALLEQRLESKGEECLFRSDQNPAREVFFTLATTIRA